LEIIEFADFLGKFDNNHFKQQRLEANPHWVQLVSCTFICRARQVYRSGMFERPLD